MDKEQKNKYLVEVKYRAEWDKIIFEEIEEQVRIFGELVLIYFKSRPEKANDEKPSPASYIRCCRVRYHDDELQAYISKGSDDL